MPAIGKIGRAAVLGLVMASSAWFQGGARGQAIAYQPVVSPLLSGVALSATPVVSADRLYVRMTLNPYFNTVNGFSTYSAQVGAVSGGNLAGMGGAIGNAGLAGGGGVAGPSGPSNGFASRPTYLAGEYFPPVAQPGAGFVGAGDPFDQATAAPRGADGPGRHPASQEMAGDQEIPDRFARDDAPQGPSVRSSKSASTRRKPPASKPARRPATKATKRRP